jgi:hypothetical protein
MAVRSISILSRDGALAAALAATFLLAAPIGAAFAGGPRVGGGVQLASSDGSGREPSDAGCTAANSTPDLYRGAGSAICGVDARRG